MVVCLYACVCVCVYRQQAVILKHKIMCLMLSGSFMCSNGIKTGTRVAAIPGYWLPWGNRERGWGGKGWALLIAFLKRDI